MVSSAWVLELDFAVTGCFMLPLITCAFPVLATSWTAQGFTYCNIREMVFVQVQVHRAGVVAVRAAKQGGGNLGSISSFSSSSLWLWVGLRLYTWIFTSYNFSNSSSSDNLTPWNFFFPNPAIIFDQWKSESITEKKLFTLWNHKWQANCNFYILLTLINDGMDDIFFFSWA